MRLRPHDRLLPGAPRWALALTGLPAAAQVVLALLGSMPAVGTAARLLLAVTPFLGLAIVLGWRARHVPHDREVWVRLSRGCLVLLATIVGAGALTVVPGLASSAANGFAIGVLLAFPYLYSGLVRWNRYRTNLADPGDVLNGTAGVLAAISVGAVVLERGTGDWTELRRVTVEVAVGLVLAGTAISAAFLGGMRHDPRPWLVSVPFTVITASGICTLATGSVPAWQSPASAVGVLCLAWAVALRPAPSAPQPTDPISSTVGAFVVILASAAVLVLASLRGGTPTAAWCAALAIAASGLRLLVNVRELAVLAVTRREALTDELTGLANRRAVLRRTTELLDGGVPTAFALLDLDRFKEVNDGLGHGAGDDLLRLVGERLQSVVRDSDLLGRLGGDEFAVVAVVDPGVTPEVAATALCRRLQAQFTEPFSLHGMSVHVGASIGATTWRADAAQPGGPTGMLREADAAMYGAKRSGRGSTLYDASLHAEGGTTLVLVEELRTGLTRGELVLHHQPQVDVRTGRTVGVEALVRWAHPTRGLLGPAEFLPVAEAHGLMGALTDQVLAGAIAQLAQWQRRGLELRMSVNLSASNLLDSRLPRRVADLLTEHAVPAGSLTLEVTETVLLADSERTASVMAALRALDVDISIDDFGTGYCSLAYLRQLPLSELKLDRSFTADLVSDARTEAIVASTVELAHRLGLRVVAEGVEDECTLARLSALGCDESQGFLHSPPLAAAELEAWLARSPAPATLVGLA
ncbi:bifunctional diguanylate cyclase/phosphodiesterase [Blastococcus sp. URHD0036]|uniref:putative bifunctional diguanylate cyclase/phosphodiesterase n=1 Tax=Blastococcus sp. URHD0036 TaxID=1380356 RepID=UPI000691AC32|nr:bifunctional diguanylate cyclase/phosphodiesterase [Blastococcus sp. URHD0036]